VKVPAPPAFRQGTFVWTVNAYYQVLPLTGGPVSGITYTMPSYVSENQTSSTLEGEYLAVMVANATAGTTQIEVFYNSDETGYGWAQTLDSSFSPLVIPNPGASNSGSPTEHSPRLVWLPANAGSQLVGLLYEAQNSEGDVELYWEVLGAMTSGRHPYRWQLAPSDPYPVGQMPTAQNFFYDSGFSVATAGPNSTDAPGTQYLAYLSTVTVGSDSYNYIETAVYTPGSPPSWVNFNQAVTAYDNDAFYTPSYVKLTYTGSNVYLFLDYKPVGGGEGSIYVDTFSATTPFASCATTPACYSHYYSLTTPAPVNTAEYGNPRIEAPEYVTGDSIPVWLQYQPPPSSSDPPVYSLLFWPLPTGD
jgi:hypothetical protein